MPRGDRRNGRNGNDGDDYGGQNRNHYWSLRETFPNLREKENSHSHLMEFEDYLVASGIAIEPQENPDYRDIINKFKAHSRTMQEFGLVCTLKIECQSYTQQMDGKQ